VEEEELLKGVNALPFFCGEGRKRKGGC